MRVRDDSVSQSPPRGLLDHRARRVDPDDIHVEARRAGQRIGSCSRPDLEIPAARLRIEQLNDPPLVHRVQRLLAQPVEHLNPGRRIGLSIDITERVLAAHHHNEPTAPRDARCPIHAVET
jgi:hypothetical protein